MTSSKAASTSSNKQNGVGLTFSIANNKLIAVNVFSPPLSNEIVVNFLPGGEATISIPVFNKSSGLVNFKSACPPLNNSLNTFWNSSLILSNVILNSSSVLAARFWLVALLYIPSKRSCSFLLLINSMYPVSAVLRESSAKRIGCCYRAVYPSRPDGVEERGNRGVRWYGISLFVGW